MPLGLAPGMKEEARVDHRATGVETGIQYSPCKPIKAETDFSREAMILGFLESETLNPNQTTRSALITEIPVSDAIPHSPFLQLQPPTNSCPPITPHVSRPLHRPPSPGRMTAVFLQHRRAFTHPNHFP